MEKLPFLLYSCNPITGHKFILRYFNDKSRSRSDLYDIVSICTRTGTRIHQRYFEEWLIDYNNCWNNFYHRTEELVSGDSSKYVLMNGPWRLRKRFVSIVAGLYAGRPINSRPDINQILFLRDILRRKHLLRHHLVLCYSWLTN